jgi:hypothetical protein
MKRLLVLVSVLVTTVIAAPAAPAAPSIQPGTFMQSKAGGCTFSFVYDGTGATAGQVFMGTAAHCVRKVGDLVALANGTVVGDAAVIGSQAKAATDWALIRIRPEYVSRVRPGVIGHPAAPSGYAKTSRPGDLVFFSGYGIPFDSVAATRQNRAGLMVSQSKTRYTLIGSDSWGDSGGPIILAGNNRAMGIVSRLCIGACTSEGPTVYGILLQAAAKGFAVRLRTV